MDETFSLRPIHVYVFSPDGQCAKYQMLEEASDSLLFALSPDNYIFYALAGVSADKYALPEKNLASASHLLKLKDPATGHAEIGAGHADVLIKSNVKNELILTITRVVAQITASISNLPEDITDVTMSLNPVETQLLLNGTFHDDTEEKEIRFSLTEKNPGEWHTADSIFVFPSKTDVTIGILLTGKNGEKRKYFYNATFGIKANYKYQINATYKAGSPDLSGVIKGTDWAGEEQIVFDFGEEEYDGSKSAYAPGEFYNTKCYILQVEEKTAGKTTLSLLYPETHNGLDLESLKKTLTSNTAGGLSGWRLFTEEEARMINRLCNEKINELNTMFAERGINTFVKNEKYLFEDEDGTLFAFPIDGAFVKEVAINKMRYYIRGIKKVTELSH
ncbi:MAG: FimB/Mfa2 family fimbrial subunit [Tannerellaceae bacterium]|jgi:hypothetical protein|nr:FimB/Mfa2 family fimbrial subunit [Tannerellaceae bacterium]